MQSLLKIIAISLVLLISIPIKSKSDEVATDTDSIETLTSDYNETLFDKDIYHPFEPVNRVIFKFNNVPFENIYC